VYCLLPTAYCLPLVTRHCLLTTDYYCLLITDNRLPITGHCLLTTTYYLLMTDYRPPITDDWLVTDYWSPPLAPHGLRELL